ncbi:MAG: hypothetical protein M3Y72_17045 [Acidobacteriota bacterium]|nr:hypothetical protein [Acidobacteriota bacterium]
MSNIFHRIEGCGTLLANPDEFLHCLRLLIAPAEVTLTNGLPHEFRDGRLPAPSAGVKRIPEVIVQV